MMNIKIDKHQDPKTFPCFISLTFRPSIYLIEYNDRLTILNYIEDQYTSYVRYQLENLSNLLLLISKNKVYDLIHFYKSHYHFIELLKRDTTVLLKPFYIKPYLYHDYITTMVDSLKSYIYAHQLNMIFNNSLESLLKFQSNIDSFLINYNHFESNKSALEFLKNR